MPMQCMYFFKCAVHSQDACKHPYHGPSHRESFAESLMVPMNTKDFAVFHVSKSHPIGAVTGLQRKPQAEG